MNYYKNLYIGENIKNIDKIINLFKVNKGLYNIYIIILEEKSNSLLNIIHSIDIFKYIYNKNNYIIIGIGKGKKETFILTEKIIKDFYLLNKDFRLFKNYFLI